MRVSVCVSVCVSVRDPLLFFKEYKHMSKKTFSMSSPPPLIAPPLTMKNPSLRDEETGDRRQETGEETGEETGDRRQERIIIRNEGYRMCVFEEIPSQRQDRCIVGDTCV